MKVLKLDFFFDGGTAEIETDSEILYVDRRIGTDTEGAIYDMYPDDPEARNVESKRDVLIKALEEYRDIVYERAKQELIEFMKQNSSTWVKS